MYIQNIGEKYARITILSFSHRDKNNHVMLNVQCDCGSIFKANRQNVLSGHTKSCGCYAKEVAARSLKGRSNIKDITGKRYGKLLILGIDKITESKRLYWSCKCDCGNIVSRRTDSLKNKSSCGCSKYSKSSNLLGKKYNRLLAVEKTNKKTEKGVIIWKFLCDCGNTIYAPSTSVKNNYTKSCGCLRDEKIKLIGLKNKGKNNGMYGKTRENNPRWKGGREEDDLIRKSSEYKNWRTKVLQRDYYKCIICGNSGKMQVHHIEPFKSNKLLRFEITNGATLCKLCHKKFHSTYGIVNFGGKEFAEFLKKSREEFTK